MKTNNKRKPNGKGKFNRGKNFEKHDDYMSNDIKSGQNGSIDEKTKSTFNDLRWYVVSDQVLNDAARLPYNIPVGMPFVRDAKFVVNTPEFNYHAHAYDDAIPGIMVSSLMPMLGSTEDGSSAAVNIAANSLFQFVRSKISGSRTYRPVDMMLYMGAMDSLYCYITWLTRLYATVYTYHQSNRYMSRALIEAQNVDYDDLVDKLTQFRSRVNILIAKTRSLYLPSVLPIFLRHSWMFSHYFIEGDSEKDQIYCHMPAGYHYFTKDNLGAGALKAVEIDDRRTSKLDVAHLLAALEAMIDPIYQDEDFNRIAGDMLKAYEGRVFTLSEIPDIATVNFANSEEVLLQFKNAKYKDVLSIDEGYYGWLDGFFDYYQNAANDPDLHAKMPLSALQCVVRTLDNSTNTASRSAELYNAAWGEWSKDTLLTSPHHDVMPGENMINTRLSLGFNVTQQPSDELSKPLMYFGSEWPVRYYLITYHKNKSTKAVSLYELKYERVLAVNGGSADAIRGYLASQVPIRSSFKYLPELTAIEYINSDVYESGRSIFEVDNYAIVSPLTLSGLHNAAILGEYNVPDLSLGK